MNTIYTLSIIVITLFLNALLTLSIPYVKAKYNAFITSIKRKKHTKPAADFTELVKIYNKINKLEARINQPTEVDGSALVNLTQRIEEIEKRLDRRQENYRQAIRQEIKNVLTELKNQK